ncbi:MAG: DUF3575 domain-containing protein [Rikenellaceae bacterium]|nr:DUF3575 domain-containing protein [Rikenellaceae bacterium]
MEEAFRGHFFGVSAAYIDYQVGGFDYFSLFDKEFFYDGKAYGGSLSYGYVMPLSERWSLELSVAAGLFRTRYDKWSCEACWEKTQKYRATYIGPASVGVKVVFNLP